MMYVARCVLRQPSVHTSSRDVRDTDWSQVVERYDHGDRTTAPAG